MAFDHDAYDRMPVTPIGPAGPLDPARATARSVIAAHAPNPNGNTSIGDGVEHAHNLLGGVSGYDYEAIIVMTDGFENAAKFLADVQPMINERVFAIGLGTAEQINPAALTQLTNDTGGYLLLTGTMGPDNLFLMSKYYLQILAGVTNQNIVVDPEGYLAPGQRHRIPFVLNEADITADVILLSGAPPTVFQFAVETPAGDIIDPAVAGANPTVTFIEGQHASYYRMSLPAAVGVGGAGAGTWHAVLTLDPTGYRRWFGSRDNDPATRQSVQVHGVRYSVSVHSLSSLRMDARLVQSSNEPGATITVRVVLTEYGLPVEQRATVSVDIERPDHTSATLAASEIEPGVFEVKTVATLSGVYPIHVHASGATLRSKPFTREQLLSGAVWKGGDNPPPDGDTDPHTRDEQICRLLECLFGSDHFPRMLMTLGADPKELEKCLRAFCRDRTASPMEAPLRHRVAPEREGAPPAAGPRARRPRRKE